MPKLIWVKSGREDGRVALFEQHPAHPGGEAFVAATPVQVAMTTLVERKLVSGELVETDEPKPKPEPQVVHKSRAEVDEEVRRSQAGVSAEPEEEESDEEPFTPIRVGERPDVKRKPGRPKKES